MSYNQYKYSSYLEYLGIQKDAYFQKRNKTWATKETIKFISDFLLNIFDIKKGLCHGSRTGKEVKMFRKYLNCEDIYGTEIAESRNKYIIQWDFHDVKKDWINSMDFIYSNSLDHAYDPEMCVQIWCACLAEKGFLILEHSLQHVKSTSVDPFGITTDDLIAIIPKWTNGEYKVSHVLETEKLHRKRRSKLLFINRCNNG